jgi:hypothetical protein
MSGWRPAGKSIFDLMLVQGGRAAVMSQALIGGTS